MILNGEKVEFPAIHKISFFKVFENLEQLAKNKDPFIAGYSKQLLKEMEPFPILREGFEDIALVDKYKEQIEKLMFTLFPPSLTLNEIKGATPPFNFQPFYTSERLKNILDAAGKDYVVELDGIDTDMMYIMSCTVILQVYYGYHINLGGPVVLEIPNKKTGTNRFYRSAFNADLMEIFPTEKALEISKEDYHLLMDNFQNIEVWKEKFPPDSWVMRGVGLINLQDITIDHNINTFTSNLFQKREGAFDQVKENLRAIFNIKDLKVTIVQGENGMFVRPPKHGMKSLLLGDDSKIECSGSMCNFGYEKLMTNREPFVLSNVPKYHKENNDYISKNLTHQNIKSYLIIPITNGDDFDAYLELGSPRSYEINSASIKKLKGILPILSMAVSRFKEEAKNRIEAIIQSEYTTIHPSVKWRFEEVAAQNMMAQQKGEIVEYKDLVFKEVYPLYGQLDIKGSSTIRNESVKSDLIKQMSAVKAILLKALKKEELPIYEEMAFRVDGYLQEIKNGLLAGSEHKITAFLNADIYPVFKHLKELGSSIEKEITDYKSMLHPELNMIYEQRRNFDESVGTINQTLANFLDGKQVEAQAMFPHYFERYKTDGVEYNMYVGQSITKRKDYDPVHLRTLQLWQLITMCEMERKFKKIKKDLKAPLEIASLVLVYGTSIAIHFRMDEKHFDIEGAYNARYEIIKKRVDKAHIKGTRQRITVPDKIAIIYSRQDDARTYRNYIKFLESKGYLLEGSLEDLELEDLQGITGLRALRVAVNFGASNEKLNNIEELIPSVEELG